MKVDIKVPAMGESITSATIGTILKPEGTLVAADDELLELETDKVNQILYSPGAGVVSWQVKPEDVVKIGQVLGSVDTSKNQTTNPSAPISESKAVANSPTTLSKKETTTQKESSISTALAAPVASNVKQDNQAKESASGARIFKSAFISDVVSNDTKKNAPVKEDSVSENQLRDAAPAPQEPSGKKETRKKMTKIRKVISQRLVEVMQQTAMLTTFNEVDMSAVMLLREQYKDTFTKLHNTKLGFMSFFVKASVAALKAFPNVNAYIDKDEIVYREYFDIGVAVGTDKGLFVPVIRNCNTLSFSDIEKSIENYAKKAREGGLIADDLQGGGFTITNGGVYGSLLSTPILNPPQSAILGMHKIQKRPVVVNDQIVIRPMMYLALSYDHRIIDGKEAVSFLVNIKNNIEDPSRLLLDI